MLVTELQQLIITQLTQLNYIGLAGFQFCFHPSQKIARSLHPGINPMSNAKVIIAVRDTDLRLSLDLMLRDEPNLNVLGTATTLQSTLVLIRIERPDLIRLEWAMCNWAIEEILEEIEDHSPKSKVILLGNSTNQEPLACQCGADAYLRIGDAPDSLRSTIKNLITKDPETIKVKE